LGLSLVLDLQEIWVFRDFSCLFTRLLLGQQLKLLLLQKIICLLYQEQQSFQISQPA